MLDQSLEVETRNSREKITEIFNVKDIISTTTSVPKFRFTIGKLFIIIIMSFHGVPGYHAMTM